MKKDTYNYLNLCDKTIHFIITRIYILPFLRLSEMNDPIDHATGLEKWELEQLELGNDVSIGDPYSTNFTSNKRLAKTK